MNISILMGVSSFRLTMSSTSEVSVLTSMTAIQIGNFSVYSHQSSTQLNSIWHWCILQPSPLSSSKHKMRDCKNKTHSLQYCFMKTMILYNKSQVTVNIVQVACVGWTPYSDTWGKWIFSSCVIYYNSLSCGRLAGLTRGGKKKKNLRLGIKLLSLCTALFISRHRAENNV